MQRNVRQEINENDWIVLTDNIGQKTFLYVEKKFYEGDQLCIVFDCDIYNLDGHYLKDCDLKVWEPKFGEWCCFYNKDSQSFRVAKFRQVGHGKGREGQFKDMQSRYTQCCEPWRNEFPYFLREEECNDVQG